MTLGDLISFQSWLKSKPKEKTVEQIKTEERIRQLLQENTAKLTAREVIKLINDYCNRNDAGIIIRRELIQEIERKYKL